MKTKIFKTYTEFSNREDKSINGVSQEFASSNPCYENDNLSNTNCWNCLNCLESKDCTDCVNCFICDNCLGCLNCFRLFGGLNLRNS